MTAGRIIKNFNGYYYVETPDKEIVTCKIKGKMKQPLTRDVPLC